MYRALATTGFSDSRFGRHVRGLRQNRAYTTYSLGVSSERIASRSLRRRSIPTARHSLLGERVATAVTTRRNVRVFPDSRASGRETADDFETARREAFDRSERSPLM